MSTIDHPLEKIRGLINTELDWPDLPKKLKTENKITFFISDSENIYDAPAFFNPVMVLNRDITILFAFLYSKKHSKKLRIFEPLAGIGVRAFRLASEIPDEIQEIVISDYNSITTSIANYNKFKLGLQGKIFQFKREAKSLTLELAENRFRYHLVDLDPFGSPSPFIDSMWSVLQRNAMIAVTATDMTALCGIFPDSCLRKYGGLPLNNHHTHGTASRLLISMIIFSAARQQRGAIPIFTTSVDHYTRVILLVKSGRGVANNAVRQIGYSYTCRECHQIYYEPLHSLKLVTCCGKLDQAGPLWIGDLFDKEWCSIALKNLDYLNLPSNKKLIKYLTEGKDSVGLQGYYVMSELCKLMKTTQPSFEDFFNEIKKKGFKIVRSWFTKQAFRSNASGKIIKETINELVVKEKLEKLHFDTGNG